MVAKDAPESVDAYATALADAVVARLTGGESAGRMSFRVAEFEQPYAGPCTRWTDHIDAVEADCFSTVDADTPDDAEILAERLLFRVARVSGGDDLETLCCLLAAPLERAFAARPHPRLFRLWCRLTAPIEVPGLVM